MANKQEIYESLHKLVGQTYSYAASLDLGPERIEAFELSEALRRLQLRGAASEMLAATTPLLAFSGDGGECDDDDDWDEDDD
ncbi:MULTISPECIES: hypothetical protein [Pantoea]|jgi:hypothetical protein|uniref:hypothetical protein n=1 Tax=Pantoea TaxID=53335 RepID=UPI0023F95667|nr:MULTISPECIES: hypothetical protein [Pantoea]MDU2730482.1 hypothetical protein [Pantoea sp.]MDU6091939.1 hypothetical protein [Staphylococcus lugdunensis]